MVKPLDKYFTQHKSTALVHSLERNWIDDLEIDLSKSTDSFFIPRGDVDQRRYVTDDGQIRFNTELHAYEVTLDGVWRPLLLDAAANLYYLSVPSNTTATPTAPGAFRYNPNHSVMEEFTDRWRPTKRVAAQAVVVSNTVTWDSYYELMSLDLVENATVVVGAPTNRKSGQEFTLVVKTVANSTLAFGSNYVLTRSTLNANVGGLTVYKFDCVGSLMVGYSA